MKARRKCLAARLPQSIPIVLLLATTASAAFQNDFSAYPTGSQQCLSQAADSSGCNGDTVEAMNECLCGNTGGFVTTAATCIGKASAGDLGAVYTTMSGACGYSNTPLAVSQKDFLAAGGNKGDGTTPATPKPTTVKATVVKTISGTPTTATTEYSITPTPVVVTTVSDGQTVTYTTSVLPTQTGDRNEGDGMSSTAKTGIIAGASVAGALIVAAIIFFFLRYRRGKTNRHEESHPMLPQNKFSSASNIGPAGDFAASQSEIGSRYSAQHDWKPDPNEAKWRPSPDHHYNASPQPSQQQQWDATAVGAGGQYPSGWGTPQQQQQQQQHAWGYSPGAAYSAAQLQQQQHAAAPAPVELAGPEPLQPAEMPASPLHHVGPQDQQPQQQQYQYPPQQQGHQAPGWQSYSEYSGR